MVQLWKPESSKTMKNMTIVYTRQKQWLSFVNLFVWNFEWLHTYMYMCANIYIDTFVSFKQKCNMLQYVVLKQCR